MRRRRFLQGAVASLGIAVGTTGLGDMVARAVTRAPLPTRTVRRFPVGSGAGAIGVVAGPSLAPSGPQSLRMAADGMFVLTDTVNQRILRWRANEQPMTIDLRDARISCALDAVESGPVTWVLDHSGERVVKFRLGQPVSEYKVSKAINAKLTRLTAPTASGVEGDVADIGSTPLVESDRAVAATHDGRDASVPTSERAVAGEQPVRIDYTNGPFRPRRALFQFDGATTVDVAVPGVLTAARYIGADAVGRRYIAVDELIPGGDVRLTVRRFTGTRLDGVAEFPLARSIGSRTPIALSPTGSVYGLLVAATDVEIVELLFVAPSIASAAFATRAASSAAVAWGTTALVGTGTVSAATRASAMGTAGAYWTHQWWCAQLNWMTCSDYGSGKTSTTPPYIYNGGYSRYYYEVPYKWGGWASLSTFDTDIGTYVRSAGDATGTGVTLSCATGVDCSGFVQNCWGYTSYKLSDRNLVDSYTTDLGKNWSQLLQADAIDWYGNHIMLFDSFQSLGGGVYVYEASNIDWRVYYRYHPYTDLGNYYAKRWCVC